MAATISIPAVSIGSSRSMPMIAMGTATMTSRDTDPATKIAIIEAIKSGYRHFDTSALYGTEPVLGSALAEALNLGLIRSRDDLFITTKLWCNRAEPHLVLPAIQKSLQDLGLEYVDMYMIHWPLVIKQEEYQSPIPKDCIFPIDLRSIWEKMEECQNLGLTRAIGVSNFSPKKLDQIVSFAKIPPAVNQVELNAVWQHKELREYCAQKNIKVSAWSPLGAPGNSWGDNRVIHCSVLQDIAKSRGKTTAQIALRWIHEQGVTIVIKSYNKERMIENLGIFDWSLTEEECNKIAQIPQRKGFYFSSITEPSDVVAQIDAEI